MPTHLMHPDAVVKLGYCFDPAFPFDDKTSHGLVEWSNPSPANEPSTSDAFSIMFKIHEAQSRSELLEVIAINASFEAKFALAKGKASLSFTRELEFTETTLIYIVQARKVFEREVVSGEIRLTEKGQKYLDKAIELAKKWEYAKVIGTEVVTGISRAAHLSLVYYFRTSSRSSCEKIRAMLEAKWKSGQAAIDLRSEITRIDNSSQLTIQALQTGANTTSAPIIDLINTSPGDLPRINECVRNALVEIRRTSSPIESFSTMLMGDMPEIAFSEFSGTFAGLQQIRRILDEKLSQLADHQLLLLQRRDVLNRFLDKGYGPGDLIPGADTKLDEIKASVAAAEVEVRVKEAEIYAARDVAACEAIRLPAAASYSLIGLILRPMVEFVQWSGIDAWWSEGSGCENWEFVDGHALCHPIIRINHPELISAIEVVCDSQTVALLDAAKLQRVVEANGVMREFVAVGGRMRSCVYAWGRHQDQLNMVVEAARSALSGRESTRSYSLSVRDIEGNVSVIALGNVAVAPQ